MTFSQYSRYSAILQIVSNGLTLLCVTETGFFDRSVAGADGQEIQ